MIDEGIVNDPPECPICMMQIELGGALEIVYSDIIDIQDICIKFINSKAITEEDLVTLNKILQRKQDGN